MTRGRLPPALALAALRAICRGRHVASLEGDLLEQCARGESPLWCWQQVGSACAHSLWRSLRKRMVPVAGASAFLLAALWLVGPFTSPLIAWTQGTGPAGVRWLQPLALSLWLVAVPLCLGTAAGSFRRWNSFGLLLVAALPVYLTPVTRAFEPALCVLCERPRPELLPGPALLLTPIVSALLVACGALLVGHGKPHVKQEVQSP